MIDGLEITTTSSICEISESQLWWRRNQGGLTFEHGVLEGIAVGTFPCAAEFLNDRNIITRLAKQGEGATRYGERLALARKAMETKAEIGAIIEKSHPELKRRGIKFPTDRSMP